MRDACGGGGGASEGGGGGGGEGYDSCDGDAGSEQVPLIGDAPGGVGFMGDGLLGDPTVGERGGPLPPRASRPELARPRVLNLTTWSSPVVEEA